MIVPRILQTGPSRGVVSRSVQQRAPVSPRTSRRTGLPPSPSFRSQCEKARRGPLRLWSAYRERCTGAVDWDLPGRGATLPVFGAALNVAASLVPGGSTVLSLLGSQATPAAVGPTSPQRPPYIPVGTYRGYPVVILTGGRL